MIDAETKLFCLLGKPARHSLSPAMYNAAFRALGLNCAYLAFEPQNLKKAVQGLLELEVRGFNLTMPFKLEVIKHLDKVDFSAQKIGAVNTVVVKNGKLTGYNTDGIGAVNALKKNTQIAERKALLLGCGGAGNAIGFYLKKEKAEIVVSDRDLQKAAKLAEKIKCKSIRIDAVKNLDGFDIIINASPAGMNPNPQQTPIRSSLLRPGLVVFDIVYDPLETKFLMDAKSAGCKTINGLEMLLEQGFEAFRLFTGKEAPKEAMRKAVMDGLSARQV